MLYDRNNFLESILRRAVEKNVIGARLNVAEFFKR